MFSSFNTQPSYTIPEEDEFSLSSTGEESLPNLALSPRLIVAADSHNLATGNQSWFSDALDSISNAPKYWSLAIGSGAVGIANTAIAIGNAFSREEDKAKEINFGKWVAEYDEDLGKYYRENASSIDLAGFVVSSLVPGTAGVKALNLGQKAIQVATSTGKLGPNTARALNLLVPKANAHIDTAAQAIASTNQRIKFLHRDVLKAVGSKTGQATLEAAVFETAVLATTFKSPFFDDMETSDIVKNFVVGTVLGGGIGGILGAATVKGAVRKQVHAIDAEYKLATQVDELPKYAPADAKLTNYANNIAAKQKYIAELETIQSPSPIVVNNLNNAKNTLRQLENEVRISVRSLSEDSPQVGNIFADQFLKMDTPSLQYNSAGVQRIVRAANIKDIPLSKGRAKQGSLGLSAADDVDGSITGISDSPVVWTKLWGDEAGSVLNGTAKPKGLTLADKVTIKSGDRGIEEAVLRASNKFKHKLIDPMDVRLASNSLDAIQSRYLWAESTSLRKNPTIGAMDFPLLDKAYHEWDTIGERVVVRTKKGKQQVMQSKEELLSYIKMAKTKAINDLAKAKRTPEEISERLNVSEGFITQAGVSAKVEDDLFFRQRVARENGLGSTRELFFRPKYMGMEYKPEVFSMMAARQLDSHMYAEAYKKVAQQATDVAVEDALSAYAQMDMYNPATGQMDLVRIAQALPDAKLVEDAVREATRSGSGAGLFTFSNGPYGSAEAVFQQAGAVVNKMDIEGIAMVKDALAPAINLLKSDAAVAAEYGTINEITARTGDIYVLSTRALEPGGEEALIPRLVNSKILHYLDEVEEGATANRGYPKLGENVPETIEFTNPGTVEVYKIHSALIEPRNKGFRHLRAAEGLESFRVDNAAYAIKPDPSTLKYYAFVTDTSIVGQGRSTMIHAASSDELATMITRIQEEFPTYRVTRKDQADDYYKALGEYDYQKTLSENHIDASLRSRGINSQFLPRTDGNVLADQLLAWHIKQQRAFHRDIVSTKYNSAFKELEWKGAQFQGLESSQYPAAYALARTAKSNPFVEYIKTALNISNVGDYKILAVINQGADQIVSSAWNSATNLLRRAKSPAELEQINSVFESHGFKTAYYDAATELLANHSAGTGVLTRFVRGAQSLLATTFLRMDFLNALNNKLGSAILTSTELRHVLRGIEEADPEQVGRLAELSRVAVPGTGGDTILSAPKLIARATSDFFSENAPALIQKYENMGLIPRDGVLSAHRSMVDDLTLTGTETAKELEGKLGAAFQKAKGFAEMAETVTGNRFIERFNRFLSARIMDQVTELGVQSGVLSQREALSYINTFVNRTQVNLIASQRPLIFQGAVGQAIGLFQSYQFNLMQQLFRYVQPGQRKSAAMLGGMQTSIYGLNGLPGFQEFNQHIIGQAYGNYTGNDIYTSLRDAAGVEAANWMLYGAPSNLLGVNLYVRGDLTPQHTFVLPTSPKDIPFVSMYSRVFGSLKNTLSNVANGAGVWNSFLAGLEANSMNRPLAGLAQVARGVTSGQGRVVSLNAAGEVVGQNDLLSIASLGRLLGGKPFDESIARNELWRYKAYQAHSNQEFKDTTRSLRVALASGSDASGMMADVLDEYVKRGKKIDRFNAWFVDQYSRVESSQAERLAGAVANNYNHRMLQLLNSTD